MGEPYEIIAAPFTVYAAPVGTAFPAINAVPGNDWIMLGAAGDRSVREDGVTVAHSQTINKVRANGSTGPRKAFRPEEDMVISFTLLDITLEQYARAINSNAVSTTAAGVGTAGFKALNMYRGVDVANMALLLRGVASAYGDGWNAQYEVPVCYQSGDAELVYVKGEPAGIALEFTALEDPDAAIAGLRFGRLVMMHAIPLVE